MNLKLIHLDFRGNFSEGFFYINEILCLCFHSAIYFQHISTFLEFTCDRNGHVIVHIDGACPGNGAHSGRGGIGVWFGDHHPLYVSGRKMWLCILCMFYNVEININIVSHRNVSEPLRRQEFHYAGPTNQVAEIKAAIKACEI